MFKAQGWGPCGGSFVLANFHAPGYILELVCPVQLYEIGPLAWISEDQLYIFHLHLGLPLARIKVHVHQLHHLFLGRVVV